MLKSIWLDGKRNRHIDHLIYMLVTEIILDLEVRHKRQALGMEGPNLAEKRCRQILTRAPETPIENIQKIDDLHFEVQSSNSKCSYHVYLDTKMCECKDFPRIQLCKHIVAIVHFFGGADLGPQPPANVGTSASEPEVPNQQDGNACSNTCATESFDSVANEIITFDSEAKGGCAA